MKQAGSATIAQAKTTAIVFGMPNEAIALGAVDVVLPLDQISKAILELVASGNGAKQRDKQTLRQKGQAHHPITGG
jgi:chemotaxis response regulator CheB